jgi:hypothetical protein
MGFNRYTNKEVILNSSLPNYGLEYTKTDLDLMKYAPYRSILSPKNSSVSTYAVELHVHSPDGDLISSNHDVAFVKLTDDTKIIQNLELNLKNEFDTLNISRGLFKIAINYHHNWVGNYWNKPLFITDISPDRTELKLAISEPLASSDSISIPSHTLADSIYVLNKFIEYIVPTNISELGYFVINFGSNNVFKLTNIKVRGNNIFVKLYQPLIDEFDLKSRLWISSEVTLPYLDNINLFSAPAEKYSNKLKQANFDLDFSYGTSTETDFKTWNELLDTNLSTSQQIIDSFFSGSIDDVKLGIDFTDYQNFINYSNAVERLSNFKYKLELIEYYNTQLSILNSASGSDAGSLQNNVATNQSRKNNVIGGFDAFERWMYTEPTSSVFSHGITGSLAPWPKYIESGSWKLHHTTSSLGLSWYTNNIADASIYDTENENALIKYIPEFVRVDSNNDQFVLFVNMIAHHYDILWTYISKLTNTYTHEEHPKLGVGKELLHDIAKSMGWNLTNGNQQQQLWQYKLGTNNTGSYQSTGSMFSKSGEDITHEVWRRIVNNMPYILKTKGTARSIKALMSAYGIPNTLLSIREYGGPKVESIKPKLTEDKFAYALRLDGNSNIDIQRNYLSSSLGTFSGGTRPPDTTEFRFRPSVTQSMSLLSCANNTNGVTYWNVSAEHTASYSGSGNYGRLTFYYYNAPGVYDSASTEYVPLYNGDFWNVRIWTNSPYTSSTNIPIYIQTARSSDVIDSKVVSATSMSLTPTVLNGYNQWAQATLNNRTLYLGGKLATGNKPNSYIGLSGSVQEYREWMEVLTQDAFNEHVLNPTSYVGNNPTSSYDTLVRHYTLGSDTLAYDHTVKLIISSSHPNQTVLDFSVPSGDTYGTYASASGFPSSPPLGDHYNRVNETYHISTPSIGASNTYSQKIRLEDNYLERPLDPETRSEISAYDRSPLDSNKLGLFYSTADQVNKDIFNQVGYIDLDDYFGSPEDEFSNSYPSLIQFTQNYWKKYSNRNDFNAYIRIFSLFDFSLFQQIKQLLPARVNARMGLLIEPNIFERSKVQVTYLPEIENPQYETIINDSSSSIYAEADTYIDSALIDIIQNIIESEAMFDTVSGSYGDIFATNNLGFVAPLTYIPSILRLTTSNLQSLYNNDPVLYNWLGLPYPITGLIYINQPTTNYYTSMSLEDPLQTIIYDQRSSNMFSKVIYHYSSSLTDPYLRGKDTIQSESLGRYYSRSLDVAVYKDDEFAGVMNAFYNGTKLTGKDFNVKSKDTIDGGPVVSFNVVNSTTIINNPAIKLGNTTNSFKLPDTNNQ